MVVLRADPWNPDYGMGYQAPPDEQALSAEPFVETDDWSNPLSPTPSTPDSICFVDGVRRVELRLVAEARGRRVVGLFGSYAVGAVRCEGRAAFDDHRVCRALILGGGVAPDRTEVVCGATILEFEPVAEAGAEPNHPLERLQKLMREAENALAARLVLDGAPLVLADGPLRLGEQTGLPVVGIVKRFVRQYLEPRHETLLGRLGPGQRTPVFALLDQEGSVRGFSWYTRLTELRRPWHDHAGIVRCEVRAGVGLESAVRLADTVSGALPAYAGRPADPRMPQNLAPVGGLEAWLRHRMGDQAVIRRGLLQWLMAAA